MPGAIRKRYMLLPVTTPTIPTVTVDILVDDLARDLHASKVGFTPNLRGLWLFAKEA